MYMCQTSLPLPLTNPVLGDVCSSEKLRKTDQSPELVHEESDETIGVNYGGSAGASAPNVGIGGRPSASSQTPKL